ncbi:hypothetical protein [Nocardioides pakistanensis]
MKRTKTRAAQRPGNRKNSPSTWWDEAEEVPRAGLPDAHRLTKRAKRYRRIVWATVFLAPLAMLSTFVAMASAGTSDEGTVVSADRYTETRSRAIYAVRTWLATDPAPLPGGILLGWESAETTSAPDGSYDVETHRLTVAEPGGNLFDTTIALGVSDNEGVVVLGQPTLMPRLPENDKWDAFLWPDVEATQTTEDIENAVWAWAQAYTSGDPDALRLAVGDPDGEHSYIPLVGATFTGVKINQAAALWPEDASAEDRRTLMPEQVVLNVTADVYWDGAKADSLGRYETAEVSYDLLVTAADTAAPRVVAWGGSGTGPALDPYANAVTGVEVTTPTVVDPSAAPEVGEDAMSEPAPAPSATPESAEPAEPSQTDPAAKPGKQKKADRDAQPKTGGTAPVTAETDEEGDQ